MNRLQRELQRLYVPQASALPDLNLDARGLVDAQGRVRAMVLELARPADWAVLSAVWSGVQADLALPAPAIAVNGSDGFQLWFSLLEPVPAAQAGAFLDALRRRYLGDMAPARVAMLPALAASSAGSPVHARPVPAVQADSGQWSVFVASNLVPMFADSPWLDVPPNPDGQAQLLAPLKSITPAEFESGRSWAREWCLSFLSSRQTHALCVRPDNALAPHHIKRRPAHHATLAMPGPLPKSHQAAHCGPGSRAIRHHKRRVEQRVSEQNRRRPMWTHLGALDVLTTRQKRRAELGCVGIRCIVLHGVRICCRRSAITRDR